MENAANILAAGVLCAAAAYLAYKALMRLAGKSTMAQDRESSAVYGMPRAAAELDAADLVLPLDRIASALQKKTSDDAGALTDGSSPK